MEELLKMAKDFMDANPLFDEVELSNLVGDKVRLVRNTSVAWYTYPSYTYPYPFYQPSY